LELKGVTIYDTKTGHLVGNQGYVSVDTPNPGEVARFDDYTARWIGTGGSLFSKVCPLHREWVRERL
jgi:hypothetical protein